MWYLRKEFNKVNFTLTLSDYFNVIKGKFLIMLIFAIFSTVMAALTLYFFNSRIFPNVFQNQKTLWSQTIWYGSICWCFFSITFAITRLFQMISFQKSANLASTKYLEQKDLWKETSNLLAAIKMTFTRETQKSVDLSTDTLFMNLNYDNFNMSNNNIYSQTNSYHRRDPWSFLGGLDFFLPTDGEIVIIIIAIIIGFLVPVIYDNIKNALNPFKIKNSPIVVENLRKIISHRQKEPFTYKSLDEQ